MCEQRRTQNEKNELFAQSYGGNKVQTDEPTISPVAEEPPQELNENELRDLFDEVSEGVVNAQKIIKEATLRLYNAGFRSLGQLAFHLEDPTLIGQTALMDRQNDQDDDEMAEALEKVPARR